MIDLSVYRIRKRVGGRAVEDFDDVVDFEDHDVSMFGPVDGPDFQAKLFLSVGPPRTPDWAPFLMVGFGSEVPIAPRRSEGALLVVRVPRSRGQSDYLVE